jgi:hypothetical protein
MSDKKSQNKQTGLILASVAVVFFFGIFVKQIWFR